MSLRFRHVDFPVPGFRELVVAIGRRRYSALELYLLAASCLALLAVGAWWAALIVPASAICFDLIISSRTRQLVRSWRWARRRRRGLNGIGEREQRRGALIERIAGLAHDADYAWRAYMADAVVGRTHSVINDRPAPKLQPLRQLDDIGREAARLNIEFWHDDASPSPEEAGRLTVPPQDSFTPDVLSPTMMNLNAASIAHAKAEGAVRAGQRPQRAVAHAAEFGPLLLFADHAVEALRDPPIGDKRGWWRRRLRWRR